MLGSGARAKEEFGKVGGGPGTIDSRLNVGRERLTDRTVLESEDEVKLWAHRKYGLHVGHKTTQLGAEFAEKIEAETEAVRLVSCAYNRAQRMSAAHKEAADMTAADAAARLELEYTHSGTRVSSVEACQIAIFADINPADLWIQYGAFFGKTFEIARFVGRINAGVEAWLGPELFETARQVLAARTQETDLSLLWVNLRELLNLAISTGQYELGLRSAEAVGGTIRIARATRQLSVGRPPGSIAQSAAADVRDCPPSGQPSHGLS